MGGLDLQIIDCHIHIRGTMSSIVNMADVMKACNLSGMNVLSVASQGGENTTQNREYPFCSTSVIHRRFGIRRERRSGLALEDGFMGYVNFAKAPDEWREFFIRYQDRILFGTDNSAGRRRPDPDRVPGARQRINAVRRFLETDGEFPAWGTIIRGISLLDREILERIYRKNFVQYAGETPKAVDIGMLIEEGERVMDMKSHLPRHSSLRSE